MAEDIQMERYERVGWLRRKWVPVEPSPRGREATPDDEAISAARAEGWEFDDSQGRYVAHLWRAGALDEALAVSDELDNPSGPGMTMLELRARYRQARP